MNPSFCQAVDGDRSSKPVNEPSLRQTLERSEPDLDAPAQTLRRRIVYTAFEFGKYFCRRENARSGGRKLDRERQSLEPSTDLRDASPVLLSQFKIWLRGLRTFQEKLHCLVSLDVLKRRKQLA